MPSSDHRDGSSSRSAASVERLPLPAPSFEAPSAPSPPSLASLANDTAPRRTAVRPLRAATRTWYVDAGGSVAPSQSLPGESFGFAGSTQYSSKVGSSVLWRVPWHSTDSDASAEGKPLRSGTSKTRAPLRPK